MIRDRLWFFTGYQYLRDYDSQPGTDPAFPRTYEQDKIFAKLTWQFTRGLHLIQSFHDEFWVNPQVPTFVMPFETTLRRHAHVPAMTFAHLSHTLSSSTLWDVRVGRFVYSRKDDPSTGDVTIPNRFDRRDGRQQRRSAAVRWRDPHSNDGKGDIQPLSARPSCRRSRVEGRHANRKGRAPRVSGYSRSVSASLTTMGNPFKRFPRVRRSAVANSSRRPSSRPTLCTLGERLTINAGLRFDHSRAISQDLRALDAQGHETGNIVRGLGTMYTWNVVSPRLGVTAKLRRWPNDIAGKLRAVLPGPVDGRGQPIHPGVTPMTTTAFDAATGCYTTLVSVVDPRSTCWSIPTRARRGPMSIRLAWIASSAPRWLWRSPTSTRAAPTISDGRMWAACISEETRTLPDGRSVPVFVLVNSTADRRFLVTNPDGYSLTYNGLVMRVEKRRSNGWQVFGSYTLSRPTDCRRPAERRRWSRSSAPWRGPSQRSAMIRTT